MLCLWLIPNVRDEQIRDVVERFYRYEQAGDFGSSWELFADEMKFKIKKETYIQRRPHVFMQDLGAKSFDFTINRPTKVSSWRMSENNAMFSRAYKMQVTQVFTGIFGTFRLVQDVYVVDENDHWRVLWSYQ
ncbi:hypothetical protein CBW46_013585 [Paenibacillus xerothermodurans]|uniref:Nuclear transport factor 2 family protein n=2 Tax=Paenibacillus xerothermodurans TaxID=1977292 RepID=A0A2W1P036_PAEXE|nr:hypothetical protein CBW46_013585 [Paenibacillus xerothermodurans]